LRGVLFATLLFGARRLCGRLCRILTRLRLLGLGLRAAVFRFCGGLATALLVLRR
jgi:hypothetical protein